MRANPVLLIVSTAVIVALVPIMPYGYYRVMRWVVSGLCIWLVIHSNDKKMEAWTWVWGIVAGVYNPIFPVHADRAVWSIVNLMTLVAAIWYYYLLKQSDKGKLDGRETR